MPNPSVTYTFTNGSTADATQVNQNFTDLINGLTDGTKNLSISAITMASTTTMSGNVVLGLSSSNTLTFNGSVASTIPVGTNTTYDLGGATLGFRSLYIGGSSTFTTRILGGTLTGSITLTTPTTVGVTGQGIKTEGTGVLRFEYPDNVLATAKTTTYVLTGVETVVFADISAGSFTITLPSVASFPYKRYTIFVTASNANISNALTIARAGSDTITDCGTTGATSTTLSTQGETIDIINDGASIWYILMRKTAMPLTAYTPTINGFGTTTNKAFYYQRSGQNLIVQGYFQTGTVAGSTASISLPGTLAVSSSVSANGEAIGNAIAATLVSGTNQIVINTTGSNTVVRFGRADQNTGLGADNGNVITGNNTGVSVSFIVPISGWNA